MERAFQEARDQATIESLERQLSLYRSGCAGGNGSPSVSPATIQMNSNDEPSLPPNDSNPLG